jgi:hypothetical protein
MEESNNIKHWMKNKNDETVDGFQQIQYFAEKEFPKQYMPRRSKRGSQRSVIAESDGDGSGDSVVPDTPKVTRKVVQKNRGKKKKK